MAEITAAHPIPSPDQRKSRSFNWRRALFTTGILITILLIVTGGFAVWAINPSIEWMPEVDLALESDSTIAVTDTGDWIAFTPQSATVDTGYVMYPGGRVPAEMYAPLARAIAEAGYYVAIAHVPLNLAFLNGGAATDIMAAHPEITTWAVGGHSLGGAVAAGYAADHADSVDALVLMAGTAFPGKDLTAADELPVLFFHATMDGVFTPDEAAAALADLPATTQEIVIEGGNHAYFGWYGKQEGDLTADITREQQQTQVIDATLALLADLDS